MAVKTLAELYGFKKSPRKVKKVSSKALRSLILREYRSILREQDEEEAAGDSEALVDINAGPDAVLSAAANLDTSVMKAGKTDAAGPDDEAFEIVGDSVTASSLEPTQSQVGSGQSINDQAGDKFGNLDRAIAGGRLASKTGEFPILVFGNKILDGHHRWSQFMATNPAASVEVAKLEAPGVDDADGALGLAHFINFALYGKSPTKDFEGENVYGMDKDALYAMALENMAETTPPKLKAAGLIEEETAEAAAEHFASNMADLPGPGSHPRTSMPQAADAGDPSGLTQTPPEVAAGAVNYLSPKSSDVDKSAEKSESRRKTGDDVLFERWQSMAGILKG